MGLKSSKCLINLSMIRFCMHDRSSGCGQRYPNFLLIRTVPNFPLAEGVRIIEVGLYLVCALVNISTLVSVMINNCTCMTIIIIIHVYKLA